MSKRKLNEDINVLQSAVDIFNKRCREIITMEEHQALLNEGRLRLEADRQQLQSERAEFEAFKASFVKERDEFNANKKEMVINLAKQYCLTILTKCDEFSDGDSTII
jgi:hypothetical protein